MGGMGLLDENSRRPRTSEREFSQARAPPCSPMGNPVCSQAAGLKRKDLLPTYWAHWCLYSGLSILSPTPSRCTLWGPWYRRDAGGPEIPHAPCVREHCRALSMAVARRRFRRPVHSCRGYRWNRRSLGWNMSVIRRGLRSAPLASGLQRERGNALPLLCPAPHMEILPEKLTRPHGGRYMGSVSLDSVPLPLEANWTKSPHQQKKGSPQAATSGVFTLLTTCKPHFALLC